MYSMAREHMPSKLKLAKVGAASLQTRTRTRIRTRTRTLTSASGYGVAVDIYSCGVALFAMLTGFR